MEMTENKIKYEKALKIYFPNGTYDIFSSKYYDWGDFSNGGNIFEYRIFSKDGKEMHVIKGYFAIREMVRKVEEEKKNEA